MTGPEAVGAALARAGAARLFFAPGADQAVVAAAARHGLATIGCPDERVAGLAAAATADLGGAPGVLLVAPDRGRAAAPAVAHARLERSALVLLGPAGDGVPAALVKARARLEAAPALALAEPPGPVLADPAAPEPPAAAAAPTPTGPEAKALDAVARALRGATRPVLVAGRGCRRPATGAWLRALAEALPAPVTATMKGKGALPDPHPLALGLVGDARVHAPVLARADLVVLLGVDALEPVPWQALADARLVHVAPWPAPGPPVRSATEARDEVDGVLEELAPRLRAAERADWDLAELDRVKRALDTAPGEDRARGRLVLDARELTPSGTVATAEPVLRAVTAACWAAVAPGDLLVPDTAPGAGFALPAALAASLARPAARVVAFVDAASLVLDFASLEVIAGLGLPVTVVVVGAPGPPVGAVARAAGMVPLEAQGAGAARDALARALAGPGPGLVWTGVV